MLEDRESISASKLREEQEELDRWGSNRLSLTIFVFFVFAALFFFVFFAPPQAVHVVNCREKKARDGPVVSEGVSRGLQKMDKAQTE